MPSVFIGRSPVETSQQRRSIFQGGGARDFRGEIISPLARDRDEHGAASIRLGAAGFSAAGFSVVC